ncbi:MAG: IPT/TIG domain-containing protein [Spirochaetia bacterium]|nr:IPT/TIG domain-containing protein [Spirochaetia bacterium]
MQVKRLISELFAFLVFIGLIGVYIYFQHLQVETPEITSITPEIGNPGDILEIQGLRFGENDNSSERKKPYNCSVFIGSRRLVLSDYLLWSDSKIEIKLPSDIKSGRLWVETEKGKSNAMLFTNRQEIPVTVSAFHAPGMPYIDRVTAVSQFPSIGDTVIIHGSGFGYEQGSGYVLFPLKAPDDSSLAGDVWEFAPSYGEYAYQSWTDTEIQVSIPDGATTGSLCVVTGAGKSNSYHLEMYEPRNQKQYVNPSGYQIEYKLEVHNFGVDKHNTVHVWMPEFATGPEQRTTEFISDRRPSLPSYRGTTLYTFQGDELSPTVEVHNSAIFQRYSIISKIDTSDIRRDYITASDFYKNYTADNPVITKNTTGVDRELKRVQPSKNPYLMCRNIYNQVIKLKRNSSLEYAAMFVAMARKSGIPARPVSGFLVSADNTAAVHYWAEFFIMGIGWLPADPVLKSFATLDADHVTFARGTAELPQISPEGFIMEPKKNLYALQNIYTEVVGPSDAVAVLWDDMQVVSRW